jgi:glycosyltransferase involved in cell wall biosynthesis
MDENQRQFHELHPRIRVVAIAKNEANCIEGFFEQFRHVTRDWCLLDTGSTDGTQDLAQAAGVQVAESPFVDFAHSRNEALERFSDGADWIVMLDADERLDFDTIVNLQGALAQAKHDIYLAPLHAIYGDGTAQEFVAKPFVFRAHPEIRWVFKVHEKVIGSHAQALVRNARIDHIMPLHDGPRREGAETLYHRLMGEEPYHTDPAYRTKMRDAWPILDYDRPDDPRLAKVYFGPLVTVVIPTLGRHDLLWRAVESVVAQDYLPLDPVVIHDGPERPGLFPDEYRVREHFLPRNHGAGGAVPRNYALWLAAGPIIAYLDDDNAWKPNHVSSVLMAMREANVPFAYSSMEVDGRDLKFELPPQERRIDTSCVLHDRSLLARVGYWKNRTEAGYAHDWEFFSRFMAAGVQVACTRKPTLIYNAATSGQQDFLAVAGEPS